MKNKSLLKSFFMTAGMALVLSGWQENIEVVSDANSQELEKTAEEYKIIDGNSITSGALWTNLGEGQVPFEDVVEIPYPTAIYDVAYITYTEEFALNKGFPLSYASPLDKGLQVFEFRMRTEGAHNLCYFKILLDHDQGLFLPPEKFSKILPSSRFGIPLELPNRLKEFVESDIEFKFRMEERGAVGKGGEQDISLNVVSVATSDFIPFQKGARFSAQLVEFVPNLYSGLDYVSIKFACSSLKIHIETHQPVIWFLKNTGVEGRTLNAPNPGDFLIINVPKSLLPKIKNIIKTDSDEKFWLLLKSFKDHFSK